MKLKSKTNFPFPTILSECVHFNKSYFKFKNTSKILDDRIIIDYKVEIESAYIKQLISSKMALVILKVQSSNSMYLEQINLDDSGKLNLNIKGLVKEIIITPQILCLESKMIYYTDEFKKKQSYTIYKSDIIGYNDSIIIKLNEKNSSLNDIFVIRKSGLNTNNVSFELNSEIIVILINNDNLYNNLSYLNNNVDYAQILYASIILPALSYALNSMYDDEYKLFRWAMYLQKLVNYKQYEFFDECYIKAQELLSDPINTVVENLIKVEEDESEDY